MMDTTEFEARTAPNSILKTQITLILDVSGSMNTEAGDGVRRIDELDTAVRKFISHDLKNLPLAGGGELAIQCFNDKCKWLKLGRTNDYVSHPFYPINRDDVPLQLPERLQGIGPTYFSQAIRAALEAQSNRDQQMQDKGQARRHKPTYILISDGHASDVGQIDDAACSMQERTLRKRGGELIFAFGTHRADMSVLKKFAPYSSLYLGERSLGDVLQLVTASLQASLDGSATLSNTPIAKSKFQLISEAVVPQEYRSVDSVLKARNPQLAGGGFYEDYE